MKKILLYLLLLLFLSCSDSTLPNKGPFNEEPMYGNIEKTEYQKECDAQFIDTVVKKSGSREEAAKEVLKLAWQYYYKGDLPTAIKRFNQVWLLDKSNPEVFWGFGLIMGVRAMKENPEENLNESIKFLEKASELSKNNPRLMIDLAYSETMLGAFLKDSKKEGFQNYFDKARNLFQKSEKLEKDSPLLYSNWSILEFFEENYIKAKEKLDIAKNLGFQPNPDYERNLEEKLKK